MLTLAERTARPPSEIDDPSVGSPSGKPIKPALTSR
jgi:hypothetical protein